MTKHTLYLASPFGFSELTGAAALRSLVTALEDFGAEERAGMWWMWSKCA